MRGAVWTVLKGALFVLFAALCIAIIQRDRITLFAYHRLSLLAFNNDTIDKLPDGLHVGLCGSGSPMFAINRHEPCVVVVAGKQFYVIDAGEDAAETMQRMGFSPGQLQAVLLTHFHSDHIDGIGQLLLQRWVRAHATSPLPIYGPPGVEEVVDGFNKAYHLDGGYRVAHHGPDIVPPEGFGAVARPFAAPPADGAVTVIEGPDLKIEAFLVDHRPIDPAVGYKVTYKGRSAVISGDTRPTASVEREAVGADLLVHEAMAKNLVAIQQTAAEEAGVTNMAHILHDITSYHSTPEDAAKIASEAEVKYLLLDHITPPIVPIMDRQFLSDAPKFYSGPIRVGRDGDVVSMPAGTMTVTLKNFPH